MSGGRWSAESDLDYRDEPWARQPLCKRCGAHLEEDHQLCEACHRESMSTQCRRADDADRVIREQAS